MSAHLFERRARPADDGRAEAAVASVSTFGAGIWASAWISLLGLAFLGRAFASATSRDPAETRIASATVPK